MIPDERGSALALVIGAAGVLFILVAVVYVYFTMNADAAAFQRNRLRAETAAEAGVALALHHLSSLDAMSGGIAPFPVRTEGDSLGWVTLPGTGRFLAVIDPINGFSGSINNGAAEIRAAGVAGDQTVTIHARVGPLYPSSYALATDAGIPQGFFQDGREVNGRVHSNGPIYFSSYSADSVGDPYVEMISTTSAGGFYFPGFGRQDVPHPPSSSIWVRPYRNHRQGKPFWSPLSPPLDFSRLEDHFRDLLQNSQAVEISAERLLVEGERIAYRESRNGPERYLNLTGVSLVIVRNGFSPVLVKGTSIPSHPLTIVASGSIGIAGSIDGGAVGSGGPLGLVSMGDVFVAADPDIYQGDDWEGRWDIETDRGILVRACILIPSGSLSAQVPYLPSDLSRLTVSGSLVQESMGRLSSGNSGYELGISWDEGLLSKHPPSFPLIGRCEVFSWMQDTGEMPENFTEDQL